MVGVRVVVGTISVAMLFGAAKGFVVLPAATMMTTNSLRAGAPRISSPLLQRSAGRRMGGLKMSSLSLDSFESGGADPEAAIKNLDELVPRSKITALIKQTSDLEGAKQCLFNIMCYSVCAASMVTMGATGPLGYWASMIAMAFVMSFNFMGLHETVHRSAFKTRLLNDAVMHFWGFLCMRPALHYFYYHWGHHKYTGDVSKDSELQPSALDMDVSNLIGYIMYISGLPFWFDASTTTLKHAVGIMPEMYLSADKAKQEVQLEARIYSLIYASLLAAGIAFPVFGMALVKFWVLPSVFGQPFLRFYLFAEHRGCPNDPTKPTENTRTMKTNWLYRKLAWDMPYHLEHHAWPYVPFHKLKDANKLLVEAGGADVLSKGPCNPKGGSGYLSLNWVFVKELFQGKSGSMPSGAA